MMELKIYNPTEDGFLKAIEWNFEELKAELTTKSEEYKTIVYTSDDQIKKEAKADRAKLRKLIDAMDSERKRIKNQCMEPVTAFEKQVKELTGIIDAAVTNIDSQVKAYEERLRNEKLAKVKEIYNETVPDTMRDYVTFKVALVDKYLLSATSLKAVREGIQSLVDRVKSDMEIINNLPEYVFEATEKYKQTLDLQWTMRTVNDLRDSAERKRLFEEQNKQRETERTERMARETEALKNANRGFEPVAPPATISNLPKIQAYEPVEPSPVYIVGLNIHGTKSELDAFCKFLNDNRIKYDVTAKPQREVIKNGSSK